MHLTSRLTIAAVCTAIAGMAFAATRQDPPKEQVQPVNEYGAAVKAFRERLDAYLDLHEKAASTVPKLKETDDPVKLTAREQAIGEAVRRARPDAKTGDVFGTELAPRIRTLIRKDWARRSPAARAGLAEDMPSGAVADVNATYPSSLPLATFPASLLAQLPPLPDGLEYRFVGRHLILRDVEANIVVDVLPNVLPGGRT